MAFKPDYGLRLVADRISSTVDLFFYNFRLSSLDVLRLGSYSTTVDHYYAGELHALSLDFDHAHLEEILAEASLRLAAKIRTELARDPATARPINFDGQIIFALRARLGTLQTVAKEQFVPLVVLEILRTGRNEPSQALREEAEKPISEHPRRPAEVTAGDTRFRRSSSEHAIDFCGVPLDCDPYVIVVSRKDVEARDVSRMVSTLKTCLDSPERARSLFEKVDVAFHGYDHDPRELFEIPEVRHYVNLLDEDFPYWLFFLTKSGLGLQCIMLCLMPPYLTTEARRTVLPQRLDELLSKRWFPATDHICAWAGFSERQVEHLTRNVGDYFINGPQT